MTLDKAPVKLYYARTKQTSHVYKRVRIDRKTRVAVYEYRGVDRETPEVE